MRKGFMAAVAVFFALLLAGCAGGSSGAGNWPEMDDLKTVKADDITSISYMRSTEDGVQSDTITDATEIEDVYLRLCNVEILSESDESVLDDGLDITVETADKEISFSFVGDILMLEAGGNYEVDNLGSLRDYIDKRIEEQSASSGGTEGQTSSGGSADYDMTEGMMTQASSDGSIAYIYFNDFLLTMPNNDKWSWEQTAPESVTFYLFSAQQEGYGGRLVTIRAFDMDDSSYEQIPSYHVAGVGKNVNKRFIAIYPTDVQWNHEDADQETDYKDLQTYLQKIGEGAVNSPLQTADSD